MSTPDDARDSESPDQDDAQDTAPPAKDKSNDKAAAKKKKVKDPDRKGIFARFALFLRQVMAELRKVIWPTRSELINYTIVVLVFVVIMALILAAYDFAFARAVFFVFDS
ncbi:MAG: preprotein translocase subunit SecE [Actinomycetota bacterium]|nr:preprotein translocase subunit SecE [Actinomycetota bacterium]